MHSRSARIIAKYGGLQKHETDCSYVWHIPAHKRCKWVHKTKMCHSNSAIQYTYILFCTFTTEIPVLFPIGLIIIIFWLFYIFLILGTTADNFFCPSLGVIAEAMRLSENIAGVTILAFGNGAPDIFTTLVSSSEQSAIVFTELIGSGVFVTTVIAGSIAVVAPFRVKMKSFMRDCCFYFSSTIWIAIIVRDQYVYFWEAISLVIIYIVFIGAVVAVQMYENHQERMRERIPSVKDSDVLHTYIENRDTSTIPHLARRSRAIGLQSKMDAIMEAEKRNAIARGEAVEAETPVIEQTVSSRPKGLIKEFFYDISPISKEDWAGANPLVKFILVIRAPPMVLLQILVPVVNQTAEKRGWSKLLNCLQLVISPQVAVHVLHIAHKTIGPLHVPFFVIPLVIGSIAAIIVFCITDLDRVPKYHNVYAFLGFIAAILVVYTLAQEVLDVLECIGYASDISDAMLGLTFLAWGNCVGDLISDISIARHGFPRMAYAACFGGPMFNTLIGLGLTYAIDAAHVVGLDIQVRTSSLAPGCIGFLLASLMCSAFYLQTTGFIARASYGFMLYGVYFLFMFICFLSEIHFIHPLGTDHPGDWLSSLSSNKPASSVTKPQEEAQQ